MTYKKIALIFLHPGICLLNLTNKCTHTHTHTHIPKHTNTQTHMYIHTNANTWHTHTCVHTFTHIQIHCIHTYTHTDAYPHVLFIFCSRCCRRYESQRGTWQTCQRVGGSQRFLLLMWSLQSATKVTEWLLYRIEIVLRLY
jgi:hypothetical protein